MFKTDQNEGFVLGAKVCNLCVFFKLARRRILGVRLLFWLALLQRAYSQFIVSVHIRKNIVFEEGKLVNFWPKLGLVHVVDLIVPNTKFSPGHQR